MILLILFGAYIIIGFTLTVITFRLILKDRDFPYKKISDYVIAGIILTEMWLPLLIECIIKHAKCKKS